ncbi:MAG TPA: hypothetical protein VMV46_23375 [Thermoanaerobaculia bacterium]|nr:hypothetical protein [Thermoanaerobaculia bacterium]
MVAAAGSQRGFALLLALLVALLASAAMMLAAAALKLEYDAARREAGRIRLGAMVDAALAETLADPRLAGLGRRPFEAGWIESRVERRPGGRARIRAAAGLGDRTRAAEIDVLLGVAGPQVVAWRPGLPR